MDIKINDTVGKYTIDTAIHKQEFYYCTECENTVKENQKFCHNCGKELKWNKQNTILK